MSLKYSIMVLSVLCGLSVSLHAAGFNVSGYTPGDKFTPGDRSQHITVTTNDVVYIKTSSGATAVVQFTSIGTFSERGPLTASYRWRYRPSQSQAIQTGKGQVRESYNWKSRGDGKDYDVTPKADHDPIVRAGGIEIKWSYGSESDGYLYYYPGRAKIQILGLDAYDRDL